MSNPYDQFDSLPLSVAEPNPYDQFDPPTAAAGNIYDQFDTAAPGTLPATRHFSPEQYQAFAGLGGLGPALAAASLPLDIAATDTAAIDNTGSPGYMVIPAGHSRPPQEGTPLAPEIAPKDTDRLNLSFSGFAAPAKVRRFDPEKPQTSDFSAGPDITDFSTRRLGVPERLKQPGTPPPTSLPSAPQLNELPQTTPQPSPETQPQSELRFGDKIKRRWSLGREQAADDQLAYRAMMGEIPWESVQDRIEPSQGRDDAKGKAWYSEGLLSAIEMLPATAESATEGAKQGLVTAGGFAGIAALAGQAGPQIAAPEELITIPVGAGMGYTVGQANGTSNYWYRQGAGSLYHDLRKEGIPHKAAQAVSGAFGFPYAAIESLQVGNSYRDSRRPLPGPSRFPSNAASSDSPRKRVRITSTTSDRN